MDILEREVPVTENNPEKSKMGLYQIKDNFLRFWFRFVYPERGRLEMGQTGYVLDRIKASFIDAHVVHIYETVCRSELWQLAISGDLRFNKLGRWWNNKEEIGYVAYVGDAVKPTLRCVCDLQAVFNIYGIRNSNGLNIAPDLGIIYIQI
jgi:AAA+ ATPase superfamily predicted ATPase